jgi:hypothetical protein
MSNDIPTNNFIEITNSSTTLPTTTTTTTSSHYLKCLRCNKRHTHKRFQGQKPHANNIPSDWQDIIGFYINKHTNKPIVLKDPTITASSVMCHSCYKHYAIGKKRQAPTLLHEEPLLLSSLPAKRTCRIKIEVSFDKVVDTMLSHSDCAAATAATTDITS